MLRYIENIDISNRIVSATSVSFISMYRHAKFLFLRADFTFLDDEASNKEFSYNLLLRFDMHEILCNGMQYLPALNGNFR